MTPEELKEFFINNARIAMNEGSTFGEEGAGFMRMNIGCPMSTLKQALNQLLEAYNKLINK
jgi:cystathionine beta-lyase